MLVFHEVSILPVRGRPPTTIVIIMEDEHFFPFTAPDTLTWLGQEMNLHSSTKVTVLGTLKEGPSVEEQLRMYQVVQQQCIRDMMVDDMFILEEYLQ